MSTTQPFISVIIPTFNRSATLRITADSFLAQSYPADRFEVIIVDNASTDDTPQVIDAIADRAPNVRGMTRHGVGATLPATARVTSRGPFLFHDDA